VINFPQLVHETFSGQQAQTENKATIALVPELVPSAFSSSRGLIGIIFD